MSTIATFRTKVAGSGTGGRLQDGAGKLGVTAGGPVDQAIAAALEEYSKLRPLNKTVKLTGAEAFRFAVSLLTGYVDQFSEISAVYVPYNDALSLSNQFALTSDLWAIERLDTGLFLTLQYSVPSTQSVLVQFTAPHVVDVSASTVPASDEEALADLATHYACLTLADLYAQSVDSTIGADGVERRGQADLYGSRARDWRAAWARKMGLDASAKPKDTCIRSVALARG